MRWTRMALGRRRLRRTAKSCGPDAPTLASSRRKAIFAGEGGKKARSPGRARNKPLKPLRGECRVIPVPPAVTNARATHHTTRGCGRIGARHSPCPLMKRAGDHKQNSDTWRREIAESCVSVIAGQRAATTDLKTLMSVGQPGRARPPDGRSGQPFNARRIAMRPLI
jgi:hypothetical protein